MNRSSLLAGWLAAAALCLIIFGCYTPADEAALKKAQSLLVSGRAEESRAAFERFIREHPESKYLPQALFGLATVEHLHLRRYDQALRAYRRLVALFPDHDLAPEALEKMADLYANNLKAYAAATDVYAALTQDYAAQTGRDDYYRERAAWCYFMMEDFSRAREAYRALVEYYPDSPLAERASVQIADSYYVQDKIVEALRAYEEALKRFPEGEFRTRIQFRMANCLEESGRLREARKLYRELLETYENPEAVRIRLSSVENRLKKGLK